MADYLDKKLYLFFYLLPNETWQPVIDDSDRLVLTTERVYADRFRVCLSERSPETVMSVSWPYRQISALMIHRWPHLRGKTDGVDVRWHAVTLEGQVLEGENPFDWIEERAARCPLPVLQKEAS